MKFEEIKKDYIQLIDEYGSPEDMTGGFVDAEKMEVVIRNPTKRNAAKYMKAVIGYGFQFGRFWRAEFHGDFDVDGDEFLERCYDLYA